MDYHDLDRMISDLHQTVHDQNPHAGYWKELWSLVREIGSNMGGVHYPYPQDKEVARRRLDELIAAAKVKGEEERRKQEERQRAWERKQSTSKDAASRIRSRADGAAMPGALQQMMSNLVLAPLNLLESSLNSAMHLEQFDEWLFNLKSASSALKEAWGEFNRNKQDMLPADKNSAYQSLMTAQERLNAAWDQWKQQKQRAWEEGQRAWEARQREREAKRADFVRRVEANIDKLEHNIGKARDALFRQQSHLAKLENDLYSAHSETFRDRCSGWIDEVRDKIRDIEDTISKQEDWLREERFKLTR